jgi:hypothetical protein
VVESFAVEEASKQQLGTLPFLRPAQNFLHYLAIQITIDE